MLKVEKSIAGCFEVLLPNHRDNRGSFTKIFTKEFFCDLGLDFQIREQYVTQSKKNVVRGLHLQLPPYDHHKMVFCLSGEAVDVALDLRRGSPSFMQIIKVNLDASIPKILFLPSGVAHGFCTPKTSCSLLYNVSSLHVPSHDTGVRWDSIDFNWPVTNPIISHRDRDLPTISEFKTPFHF